jgi:hypothetical protein
MEMLLVVAIVGLMIGISFPAVNTGLSSIRLRSAGTATVGFLSQALNLAERTQTPVQILIDPERRLLSMRSVDGLEGEEVELPAEIRIVQIYPELISGETIARQFFLYPGGRIPAIGIELQNDRGARRLVSVDPITTTARVQNPDAEERQ